MSAARIFGVKNIVSAIVSELSKTRITYDKDDVLAQANDLVKNLTDLLHLSQASRVFRNTCQAAMWTATGGLRGLLVRIPSALEPSQAPTPESAGDWKILQDACADIRTLYLDVRSRASSPLHSTAASQCTSNDLDILRSCSDFITLPQANTIMVRIHGSDALRSLLCLFSTSLLRLEIEFDPDNIPEDESIEEFFDRLPRAAPDLNRLRIMGPLTYDSQRAVDESVLHFRRLEYLCIHVDDFVQPKEDSRLSLEELELGYVPADGRDPFRLSWYAPLLKKLTLCGASPSIGGILDRIEHEPLKLSELVDLTLDLQHDGTDTSTFWMWCIGSSIPQSCPKLRRLIINSLDQSNAQPMMLYAYALGRHVLQELVMKDEFVLEDRLTFLNDGEVELLARALPDLRSIKLLQTSLHRLSVCVLSAEGLVTLILICPNLRVVSASVDLSGQHGTALLSNPFPRFPASTHNLEELELGAPSQVPDETVAAALKSLYWRNAKVSYRRW